MMTQEKRTKEPLPAWQGGPLDQVSHSENQESQTGTGSDELVRLRTEIDDLDDRLVELIASRLQLALETKQVKEKYGLEVRDTNREAAVVRKAAERARTANLETETVRAIFWRLIDHSWWGYEREEQSKASKGERS